MTLCYRRPLSRLSDFVDVLWLCEDYRPAHRKERILPDGRTALVINLREDHLRLYDPNAPERFETVAGSLVAGSRSEFHIIDTACQEFIMGAHFKPGGAFPFLKRPADEVAEGDVPLADLWGAAEAGELREQLLEAATPTEKFRVLESALLSKLNVASPRHPAVSFALREFERAPFLNSVSAVTRQIGLSDRRFIQRFREEVGLTPKRFCRLRRFHEVIRVVHRAKEVNWADLALSCGYFDQAHFIHDFQAFSGLNPSAYWSQRGEYLNHIPLPE